MSHREHLLRPVAGEESQSKPVPLDARPGREHLTERLAPAEDGDDGDACAERDEPEIRTRQRLEHTLNAHRSQEDGRQKQCGPEAREDVDGTAIPRRIDGGHDADDVPDTYPPVERSDSCQTRRGVHLGRSLDGSDPD